MYRKKHLCLCASIYNNCWWLISEYINLLSWLTNSDCKHLPKHICVSLTFTKPTFGLYGNYVEWMSVKVSGRTHLIWNDQKMKKTNMLKPLVIMTCNFVPEQPSMSSKLFHLSILTHKYSVNAWYAFQAFYISQV